MMASHRSRSSSEEGGEVSTSGRSSANSASAADVMEKLLAANRQVIRRSNTLLAHPVFC